MSVQSNAIRKSPKSFIETMMKDNHLSADGQQLLTLLGNVCLELIQRNTQLQEQVNRLEQEVGSFYDNPPVGLKLQE